MRVSFEVLKGSALTNSIGNESIARHRWYPIKEGFSPKFVSDSYKELADHSQKKVVAIEPFSGSGTVPVECAQLGISCRAYEINPFLAFVGRTKLGQVDPKLVRHNSERVLAGLRRPTVSRLEKLSTFCEGDKREKWLFNRSVLRAFAGGWQAISECSTNLRSFYRLALIRSAMDNCNAYPDGKCLRYKRLKNFDCFNGESVAAHFKTYCDEIAEDLEAVPLVGELSSVKCMDSRELAKQVAERRFDLCVTSPPYLNSFDYSDVYRPELFLGGFVADNKHLMRIRLKTVRSHVQANWKTPVEDDFGTMYAKVVKDVLIRKDKLWSKRIPEMIQAYFEDMQNLLVALSERANPGALLKIAVATSAYGGVVIPVDFILAEIAEKAGWEFHEVRVIRRLRSSAQLWKHEDGHSNVPELRESVLVMRFPDGLRRVPKRNWAVAPPLVKL